MTLDEMFNELNELENLEDKARDTFIVTLKYKYDFEKNYTIENQILEYDSLNDNYVWLNDWYEGQTDVEVLGYMLLGDVDTITPQPQTGHWIDEGQYAEGHSHHAYECSECGNHIIELKPDDFCKFCGADMRGVIQNDE